jgi:membrane associated rhomboid family serine protease
MQVANLPREVAMLGYLAAAAAAINVGFLIHDTITGNAVSAGVEGSVAAFAAYYAFRETINEVANRKWAQHPDVKTKKLSRSSPAP